MSTFRGKIDEIPEISIDRFDRDNFDADAFFLSHCHLDHMQGLDSPTFRKNLVTKARSIYLSHVSAEIIKNMYSDLENNLVELEFHSSTVVTLPNKTVTVTPIPAGHCPGSVMFLFEADQTVLYTGDYRINPLDFPKFRAFFDSMGNQKKIHAVYLDTSFFLKRWEKFPPRNESLEEICTIIKDWISRSDKHVVSLNTQAKYGYEYLFMEIYKKLKIPVHVNSDIFAFYSRVPELDQAVTRSKDKTSIHSACGSHHTTICCNTITYKIKTIKVSAFRWTSEHLHNGISENTQNTHFVCYSTHASYEEGAALLRFLKPKKAEPNVLHRVAVDNDEIFDNLREFVEDEEPEVKKVKLFPMVEEKTRCEEGGVELTDIERSILESPPRPGVNSDL